LITIQPKQQKILADFIFKKFSPIILQTRFSMFRNILLFVFVIAILFFSSESNPTNKYEKPTHEFSVGQIIYTIYGHSYGTGVTKDASQLDSSGGYFLQIFLTLTNRTANTLKFDTSMFKLSNSEKQLFRFSNNMDEYFSYFDSSLNAKEIPSNSSKSGFVIFNVPKIGEYILSLNNGSWTKESASAVIKP
jgi:hypothetical protein